MTDPRALTCRCGQMEWHVASDAPGLHLRCYCADCQTFARHLDHAGMLSDHGGTDIFQTLPETFQITRGAEHLALLRLSPKGLLRWYAGCCGTPIANTLPRPGLPFVGMILPQGAHGFGPVVAEVNTDTTRGAVRQYGFARVGFSVLGRGLAAKLAGRTASPFFGPDKAPVVPPVVLTLDQRNAARPS